MKSMRSVNECFRFVALLKDCAKKKDLCKGIKLHEEVLERGLTENSSYISSALIAMYMKCGDVGKAQKSFDELSIQDTVSWNALISGYQQQNYGYEALCCFDRMRNECILPNMITFLCVLKVCGQAKEIEKGKGIHIEVVRRRSLLELEKNVTLENTLVDMYAKCGILENAKQALEDIPIRDVVSWNVMISGYVQHEHFHEALTCFQLMQAEGLFPDSITFICILKCSSNLGSIDIGEQIHHSISTMGLLEKDNIVLGTAVVDMYAKCGMLAKAQELLEELPIRDIVAWNALIGGYIHHGQGREALTSFEHMKCEGYSPNIVTFIFILKACGIIKAIDKGKEIHEKVDSIGLLSKDVALGNALIDMYVKCGMSSKAKEVLEKLPLRNIVSWNALIAGFAQEEDQCHKAFKCFEQMQSDGFSPDSISLIGILKACAIGNEIEIGVKIHDEIVSRALLGKDTLLGNSLVHMYAKCGRLVRAQEVLDELPIQDVVSWNALISGYVQYGHEHEALKSLQQMQCQGLCPDGVTFICVLKACGNVGALENGKHIHADIAVMGWLEKDIVLGTALLEMYMKCGMPAKAYQVFKEELCARNTATWSALIAEYAQQGHGHETLKCFEVMQTENISPDVVTFISILKVYVSGRTMYEGPQTHRNIMSRCLLENFVVFGVPLIGMYAKFSLLVSKEPPVQIMASWFLLIRVHELFNCFERKNVHNKNCEKLMKPHKVTVLQDDIMRGGLLEKVPYMNMHIDCRLLAKGIQLHDQCLAQNVVSWNALIAQYAQQGQFYETLNCFEQMQSEGLVPNVVTFISALRACGKTRMVYKGQKIHEEIVKKGLLEKNVVLGNTLVYMYVGCGLLTDAQRLLEGLPVRDAISWSTLISGYTQYGLCIEALNCFEQMEYEGFSPNVVTFVSVLKACGSVGVVDKGNQIHEKLVQKGLIEKYTMLGTALVDMYAKCAVLVKAHNVLLELPIRDIVSWNALITGYSQQGQGHEILKCYNRMQCEGLSPDEVTSICVLKACGNTSSIDKGIQIHSKIVSRILAYSGDTVLGTTLVDMYAKCGMLTKAQQVLEELPTRNTVSWNVMIAGYARRGQGYRALNCFQQMQSEGLSPDNVSFLSVLTACSRSGLLSEAQLVFQNMSNEYGITPSLEHQTCLVDIFGCGGHFEKAMSVIKVMPSSNYPAIWRSVLGACRRWGNLEIGRLAFHHASQLDTWCATSYVLMANIFACANMEEDTKKVLMTSLNVHQEVLDDKYKHVLREHSEELLFHNNYIQHVGDLCFAM